MHWFLDPIRYHYLDFSGRATRTEYWMFAFHFCGIVGSLLLLASMAERMVIALIPVFIFTILLPGCALTVRRLRDAGYSAWWALAGFVPVGQLIVPLLCCFPSITE